VTLLCSCIGSHGSQTNASQLAGDARDQQLVKAGTAAYLRAKYFGNIFGTRRPLLEQSQALLKEALNDSAASTKTRIEADDMLRKVNEQLETSPPAH
jgi:hypothetical protein